jgi:sigma-B regulation protein RsbU (phosphoserine phosphatase)
MYKVLPDSDFLTTFYGIVDLSTLTLLYTNAGHPSPFLYRGRTGEIEWLSAGGPLVGAFPGMEYDDGYVQLSQGDRILVFTDGITEANKVAASEDLYGQDRLKRVFLDSLSSRAEDILSKITEDLEDFRGAMAFDDDITLLLLSVG